MGEFTELENIVRVGRVSSVDIQNRTARVIFEDKCETFVSGELKVLKNPPFIPAAGAAQKTENESGGSGDAAFESHSHDVIISPWLPKVGELVLCIYLVNGNDGFVVGGI